MTHSKSIRLGEVDAAARENRVKDIDELCGDVRQRQIRDDAVFSEAATDQLLRRVRLPYYLFESFNSNCHFYH